MLLGIVALMLVLVIISNVVRLLVPRNASGGVTGYCSPHLVLVIISNVTTFVLVPRNPSGH